jgi:hypothetical protein
MPKLIVHHYHKVKLIVNQSKSLGKVGKKTRDICQQWACKDTRKTKHYKHQVILMHAKRAHANKSRGNYDLDQHTRRQIKVIYLLNELMLTRNKWNQK